MKALSAVNITLLQVVGIGFRANEVFRFVRLLKDGAHRLRRKVEGNGFCFRVKRILRLRRLFVGRLRGDNGAPSLDG